MMGRSSLQAPKAYGRLPLAGYLTGRLLEGGPTLKADSKKPAIEDADFPEPATKNADSKKLAKTAPTKTTPT